MEYGGVIVSLAAALLSDVMNADPQTVKSVWSSGLASLFMSMVSSRSVSPTAELILAIPPLLASLSLTEDGANKVLEVNPFPAALSIFHDARYVMPLSRSMQNDLPAIFGTNLDEVVRHVPKVSEHKF